MVALPVTLCDGAPYESRACAEPCAQLNTKQVYFIEHLELKQQLRHASFASREKAHGPSRRLREANNKLEAYSTSNQKTARQQAPKLRAVVGSARWVLGAPHSRLLQAL